MKKVFYVPGSAWVQDYAATRDDGVLVTLQTGETLNQLLREYPTIEVLDQDVAANKIEDLAKTTPHQIDRQAFEYALEVLPPHDWVFDKHGESFKMCERTCDRVTAIYARVGNNHWKFHDLYTLTHQEVLERVRVATKA